jgi:predicted nucleic acid-binding protein
VIVCPNTSPLIVLARIEQLGLLGDPADVRLTRAVQDEIRDKQDEVAARVATLVATTPIVDDAPSARVDPMRGLGRGERSVLSYALAAGADVLCVLDDAAARAEARRLQVSFTGTLGLILKAKTAGRVSQAAPLLRRAVEAGLYLDDSTLRRALTAVGEVWPG